MHLTITVQSSGAQRLFDHPVYETFTQTISIKHANICIGIIFHPQQGLNYGILKATYVAYDSQYLKCGNPKKHTCNTVN